MPVKVTVLLFMVAVIAFLTWFLPISTKREEIAAAEAEQQTLLDQYRQKESKARHLKEYQAQVSKMINSLKGVSSRLLKKQFPSITKWYYNNKSLWSPSYFAASCGGAPIGIIRQYIEQQKTPE